MERLFFRIAGPVVLMLLGDTAVFDRWLWLRKYLKSGPLRTLDAGCGSGALTIYAARRGNDAVGVSFEERNNRVARERAAFFGLKAEFIDGDLRKLDELASRLGMFDQIICFETIEHIMNDRKLLRDFSNVLKPGGRLLLSTPYAHYHRSMGGAISDIENGDHVRWGYTREEAESLLREAGLELVVCSYVTGVVSQQLIRFYRWLSGKIPYKLAWAVIFPLRLCIVLDPVLTPLFRWPYLSIAVMARKNK